MTKKLTVTVFGAGISGLTAAHELAIRGFAVTVIDKDINECVRDGTYDNGIGGIARSQFFGQYPTGASGGTPTTDDDAHEQNRHVDIPRLRPLSDFMYDETLEFQPGNATVASESDAQRFAAGVRKMLAANETFKILFPIAPDHDAAGQTVLDARIACVAGMLGKPDISMHIDTTTAEVVRERDWVVIGTAVKIFPGEHGFRFFPSFYRHLFDTMRRTPVLVPKDSERASKTVYDNLVPVEQLGFARGGSRTSFALPRHPVLSFELIRTYLRQITTELGYSLDDLARFELMLFRYMTSCSERRERDYEGMSWADCIDLAKYSKTFQQHLENGPLMALALRGSEGDARTQGNIVTQLLRDQLVAERHPDSTLAAPTSSAWFLHWRTYLRSQKVNFQRGELVGFAGAAGRVVPTVTTRDAYVPTDYVVIAFALPQLDALVDAFLAAAQQANITLPADNDLAKTRAFVGANLDADLRKAKPDGPLQHLAGIQFYFDTEVNFWRGHTQYLDSTWSLSSIAQPQFWARFRSPNDNFRSLLSVDIGDWKTDHGVGEPGAWLQTPEKIASLAWTQIRDHHDDAFYEQFGKRARFPRPFAFALDRGIDCTNAQKLDSTPYLVPKVGQFRKRPGKISDGTTPKNQSSYELISGIVFAGTHMQTFTRLTSMETANESARHAVNAILDDAHVAGDRCAIWDPEDHELDDLTWFKDLDRALLKKQLPHFIDTLGWRELPALLPTDLKGLKLGRAM
ncbi:MAG: NAD(P)-binding protein [Kofleriaceae bacterium]